LMIQIQDLKPLLVGEFFESCRATDTSGVMPVKG
jgi:hypothetical protein